VQLSSNRRRESYENACGAQDAGTYDEASRTGGANGSVAYELDRPENFGLNRGFRPIEKVRTVQHCPMHAFFSLLCIRRVASAASDSPYGGQDTQAMGFS
jgi:hypothetical protein